MKTPSNKNFGIVFSIFFFIMALFFFNSSLTIYFLILSILFLILAFFFSKLLTPLNIYWTKLGFFLGRIVSPVVMMIVYFLGVLGTKIFLLLFNKDILNLKLNKKTNSYWVTEKVNHNQTMDQQF